MLSLFTGVLAGSAQADDPQPGDPTTSTDASTEGPSDPSATDTTSPRAGLLSELGQPQARPDEVVWKRGLRGNVGVAANDTCPATCTYQVVSKPADWPKITITSSGVMTVSVPSDVRPGTYRIPYRLIDSNSLNTSDSTMTFRVTPDNYKAPNGVAFSHPYRKGYKYKVRDRILRTINSVPPGGRIQVASWSFSSKTYWQALNQARKRGVVVQIVLAYRNKAKNSDYRKLRRLFGTTVTPNGNWVKKCSKSCRGRSGTMHSKIFLFSSSYRTPYVIMTGSANLTDFAVTNQWNQMNVVSGNKPVYDEGVRIFQQMVLDRQAVPMYVSTTFPNIISYYYPTTAARTSTDFMYQALSRVHCRGATNTSGGRTVIKIAMYAWYQARGKWLAKQVRKLWGEGCRIQIVYAISSDPVKKILYSPSGRGRIPMRQILLANTKGTPIYYLHDKWVAIRGWYGGNRGTTVSFQGSFNFSDLGFRSDENFQALFGSSYYRMFKRDFDLLWRDRQARAPSPISKIPTIEGRYTRNDLRLGRGVYRYMEAD